MAVAQKVSALCSDARLAVGTLFLLGFKSLQTVPKRTWRPVKHRTAEVSQASGSLTSLSDQPPSADTRAGPHLPRPPRGCGRLSKRKLQTQARISPPASASHLVLKKINPAMPLVFQKSVEGPAVRQVITRRAWATAGPALRPSPLCLPQSHCPVAVFVTGALVSPTREHRASHSTSPWDGVSDSFSSGDSVV